MKDQPISITIRGREVTKTIIITSIAILLVDNLIWLILVGAFILGSIFIPYFLSIRNFINLVYHSTPLAVLAIAQAIALTSGNFDLSIESTLAFSVAIPAILMTSFGLNPYAGIFLVLLIGAGVGSVNGFLVGKLKVNPFLVTLAMLIMLRGLVLYLVPLTLTGFPDQFNFVGSAKLFIVPVSIIVVIGVYFVFHIVLTQMRFGREIVSVGGNKNAAFVAGINVNSTIVKVLILSGTLAGLAGLIMAGRLESVMSPMGEGMVFMSFAAAVMGGVSLQGGICPIHGVFAGVLVIGLIENTLSLMHISPYIVYAVKGLLIFVAIIIDRFKVDIRTRILMRQK